MQIKMLKFEYFTCYLKVNKTNVIYIKTQKLLIKTFLTKILARK